MVIIFINFVSITLRAKSIIKLQLKVSVFVSLFNIVLGKILKLENEFYYISWRYKMKAKIVFATLFLIILYGVFGPTKDGREPFPAKVSDPI